MNRRHDDYEWRDAILSNVGHEAVREADRRREAAKREPTGRDWFEALTGAALMGAFLGALAALAF